MDVYVHIPCVFSHLDSSVPIIGSGFCHDPYQDKVVNENECMLIYFFPAGVLISHFTQVRGSGISCELKTEIVSCSHFTAHTPFSTHSVQQNTALM